MTKLPGVKDREIRSTLKDCLRLEYCFDEKMQILDEFGINYGEVRADVVAVGDVMHGYEIKSDYDSLNRLPNQIKAYNAVFDKVTIVTGASHIYSVIEIVPEWWGILVVRANDTGEITLHCIREAEANKNLDTHALARLLWRDEAMQILEGINAAHGVRTKPKSILCDRLTDSLEQESLRRKVVEKIHFRSALRAG
ncbi:sce7726 family protein [Candidatus Saccharibacteria bacterium]|nr:sce7726 family protein [Candidatus Saccharibacteria bacterium]